MSRPAAFLRPALRARLVAFAALVMPAHGLAQDALPDFREEIGLQFEASARKLVALAEAMPADSYGWSPMDGVASVARVYMHIAHYNYLYPEQNLGVAPPADARGHAGWEDGVGDKAEVVRILAASMDHVRAVIGSLSDEELSTATRLYGRNVPKSAVLLQLVTHMNEHLGQSIAYARMNGVVPPWSS